MHVLESILMLTGTLAVICAIAFLAIVLIVAIVILLEGIL